MRQLNNTIIVGCAITAALAAGCTRESTRPAISGDATGATGVAADTHGADRDTITLIGCLQKTEGITGDYILTQVKSGSSSEPVGTSGPANKGAPVERRQLIAAQHSVRLGGDSDQLKDLVGHQVRVSGTFADRGDLANGKRLDDKSANSGRDLKESDLAKVDVSSVQSIADACSNSLPGAKSKR
jgi:hypothetical protein